MSACITPAFLPGNSCPAYKRNINTRFWEVGEYSVLYQALNNFLTKVLNTNEVAFKVLSPDGHRVSSSRVRESAQALAMAMGHCRAFMDLYEPRWNYTADMKLYFDCYRQHPFGLVEPGMAAHERFNEYAFIAEVYNDFIDFLRKEAVTRRVRKRLADWKAGLSHQDERTHAYLQELFKKNGWLLPVRIDHFYAADAVDERDLLPRMSWRPLPFGGWSRVPSDASSSPEPVGETRARIDTGMAMAHRGLFFGNQYGADRWLFEHMVGSIWKMETGGKSSANHFHGLYLFDGTKMTVPDLARLIAALTNRWSSVTGGLGLSYNCHESPGRQHMVANGTWALKMLDCENPAHRDTLDAYVRRYFAKDDEQRVRIKPTARANTLTMKHGRREAGAN